jgi:two-component system nitrogen regulation response regulator NtrX
MRKEKRTVLLVDDEEKILVSLASLLERGGLRIIKTTQGDQALPLIEHDNIDIVILDIMMPEVDGMTILRQVNEKHPHIPVIMLTGHGTISRAVEATKAGAFDFLEKPVESEKILISIENALQKSRLEQERSFLIKDALERYRMVGISQAMKNIFRLIEKTAAADSRILIMGESGTGKELVARAIHLRSDRAGAPFMTVNCAAIPDDLIESELFGHEKGAFTGAVQRQLGKFEQAAGGTLFLDEIGDMSLRIQAKILRAIEEMQIMRVGGKDVIQVGARIIAASNKDLKKEVREKNFREDLYFRISVINIQVPPLRERKEDIPALAEFFVRAICQERKRPQLRFQPSALEAVISYEWPGNVRELKNLVEKAVVLTPSDVISRDEISVYLKDSSFEEGPARGAEGEGRSSDEMTLASVRSRAEREALLAKLLANNWDYKKTAKELAISRATLFNKLSEYKIRKV